MAEAGRRLDINKAKLHFLSNFESLSRLPLIADSEMIELFGEEVNLALSELEYFNRQENICLNCESRCCLLVDCELYSPAFSRCPIRPFRPVICRIHFCNKFASKYNSLVKELGDIFLECLISAEKIDKIKAGPFDSPPLNQYAPGFIAVVAPYVTAFKQGRLDQSAALSLIESEADKFKNVSSLRNPNSSLQGDLNSSEAIVHTTCQSHHEV